MDHFLVAEPSLGLTRSQIKRLIDEGRVTVGGKVVKTSSKIRIGDEAIVRQSPPKPLHAVAQEIPLNILYEDSHLIVVNKAAGMVVHPAPGHPDGTLVNALLGHCDDLSGIGGTIRPGIVHRIDKDTTGILVVSKEDGTHQTLADGFKNKVHRREYIAISTPAPKLDRMVIDTLHARHPVHRKKFSSQVSRGKTAVTHLQVTERFARAALLRLRLETGRTHQIRVHCADSGFPLLGDPMYGRLPKSEPLRSLAQGLNRQALHASHLGFVHPVTKEKLSFDSPLPQDMQAVLEALRQGELK